jgi:Ca2+-binding RTX toxin-like protein
MRIRVVLVLAVLAVLALPAGPVAAVPTCMGVPATIWGTEGGDTLTGTIGDDVIQGSGGNDLIYGGHGTDLICGGNGDDWILGEDDNDPLYGDAGNDTLLGGPGTDRLHGGDGNDVLDQGLGATSVSEGEAGNDLIRLGRVEQYDEHNVWGGPGRDTLDLRYVPVGGDSVGVHILMEQSGYNLFLGNCPPPGWHCWTAVMPSGLVSSIEVIYGTQGNDNLEGNASRNVLYGLGGPGIAW